MELTAKEKALIQSHDWRSNVDHRRMQIVLNCMYGVEQAIRMCLEYGNLEQPITDFSPSQKKLYRELFEQLWNGKRSLVVSGYGPNAQMMSEYGASEAVLIDSDPVTIAWQKALTLYWNHQDPNVQKTVKEWAASELVFDLKPLKKLLRKCLADDVPTSPLEGLEVRRAVLGDPMDYAASITRVLDDNEPFDSAFVPFLIGETNGITDERKVHKAWDDLHGLIVDGGWILVAYSRRMILPEFMRHRLEVVPSSEFTGMDASKGDWENYLRYGVDTDDHFPFSLIRVKK